jgi:RsiW-degrading membrane proteinase PrsW (M82 family)
MHVHPLAVPAACLLSGIGWAVAAASRGGGTPRAAVRPLLGGGAAFGIALGAYELLKAWGAEVRWEQVLAGGGGAVLIAFAIGLVEEGAKLAGVALATIGPPQPGAVMRTTFGVAAGFAALESLLALAGVAPAVGVARALLAPVAHAVLSAPLAFAVAASAGRAPWRTLRLAAGLLAAASLHAAGDLSLAAPRYGRIGYAAALLAPVLVAFLHARRVAPAPATAGGDATAGPRPG